VIHKDRGNASMCAICYQCLCRAFFFPFLLVSNRKKNQKIKKEETTLKFFAVTASPSGPVIGQL